jgi:hypothetical protein
VAVVQVEQLVRDIISAAAYVRDHAGQLSGVERLESIRVLHLFDLARMPDEPLSEDALMVMLSRSTEHLRAVTICRVIFAVFGADRGNAAGETLRTYTAMWLGVRELSRVRAAQ